VRLNSWVIERSNGQIAENRVSTFSHRNVKQVAIRQKFPPCKGSDSRGSFNMFSPELSDADFRRFSKLVYDKCGICLGGGKKELVRARLNKRLRETGIHNFKDYYRFLTKQDNGRELVKMVDAISTNVTSFFRQQTHFDFLRETVFPSVKESQNRIGSRRLLFWSAGCSTGQEPYSLAISFLEYFGGRNSHDLRILATDISTNVLEQAQRGVYPAACLKGIPQTILRKYFQRGYGSQSAKYRIKESVKKLILFKWLNLMEPFSFRHAFDLILCRNVMIYFDKDTRERLVGKFYNCLVDGGYLIVGGSESLAGSDHRFKYIRPSIYQK